MLYGIDISNHQGGLKLSSLPSTVQFVICKATEGLTFVDKFCDPWVQDCIKRGIPWGFYHFAGKNGPKAEAAFFIQNCSRYFGRGIPVLDWEGEQTVTWVNEFVRYVHKKTEVWPWIYANPWRFNQGGVEQNCARWIAQYPSPVTTFADRPTSIPKTDGNVVAWQFTSSGKLKGWNGNLDLDVFYGNFKAWEDYARGDKKDELPAIRPANPTVTLENDQYKVDITPK